MKDVTWRWWVLQLTIPIIIAICVIVLELGHLLGYLPP